MKQKIINAINNTISINQSLLELAPTIEKAANLILKTYNNNGKVLLFGNGGSAADAQHIAAELLVRFYKNRSALAAIALTTNSSITTACANDFTYDYVFKRQIEALAKPEDCVIAISTSGKSKNVIAAAESAAKIGCSIISLTGKSPKDELKKLSGLTIAVHSNDTPRIQEAHVLIGHIMCELVEKTLFCE